MDNSKDSKADKPIRTGLRAADNPAGAALLGALLVREGTADHDPATVQAGHNLLRVAEDHWPTPIPEDKRLPR